jgi:spore coat polysaccharide biosynthesis protein SpsF (cytidylyltransferase family)
MYKNAFKNINYIEFFNKNYSNLRLTLDYAEDYLFFIKNFNKLKQLPLSKKPEVILDKII